MNYKSYLTGGLVFLVGLSTAVSCHERNEKLENFKAAVKEASQKDFFVDEGFIVESGNKYIAKGSLAFGDIDNDRDLDLLVSDGLGRVTCYEKIGSNYENRGFLNSEINEQPWGSDIALGDLDNDGDLDLIVADSYARIKYYENEGFGSFKDRGFVNAAKHLYPGDCRVRLNDIDGDGDLDISYTDNFINIHCIRNTFPVFEDVKSPTNLKK